MSRAEEKSLEKYPIEMYKEVGWRCVDKNVYKRKYFIEGYHQAEKDLDISLVKEVSGVKEMKRAKEEALKAYPPRSIAANYDTISRRDAFEFGYLKAEKDLELSWEDIKDIFNIYEEVIDMDFCKDIFGEVLKRFKDYKERKEK